MQFTSFAAAALGLACFAMPSWSATDRFLQYKTQTPSSTALKLNDALFDEVTKTPRDYHIAVLLTALPAQFGCQPCREFQAEWDLVATQWNKADKSGASRVLFTTADFPENKATFAKLMLQTAPKVMLFPPTSGPGAKADGAPARLEFTQGILPAEQVHAWLERHLPGDVPYPAFKRPVNWMAVVIWTTIVLTLISLVAVAGPYVLPLAQNRNLWAAVSLIAILMFTSGHMYNHIRKVPYISGDGQGGISYFAPGFQNQFGMETQIVAAMYGVLAFATIALALRVPRIESVKNQQVAVVVWAAVTFSMYSFLMSVFRVKNGGYPFYLPPF